MAQTVLQALPIGTGGSADSRFKPKTVTVPIQFGAAEADPNAGANNAAINAAQPPPGGGLQQAGQDVLPQVPVQGTPPQILNPFGGGNFNPLSGTGIGGLSPGQNIGVNFGNPLAGTGIGGLSPGQQIGVNFGNPLGGTGIGGLSPNQGFSRFQQPVAQPGTPPPGLVGRGGASGSKNN